MATFLIVLAIASALVAVIALWQSFTRAADAMETRQIARDCCPRYRDGGRYMGSDRR